MTVKWHAKPGYIPEYGEIDESEQEKKVVIFVEGKAYDITNWIPIHPGGEIIREYNGLDATQAFIAFHGEVGRKKLAGMTPLKGYNVIDPFKAQTPKVQEILTDFETLRVDLIKQGYFRTSLFWYTYKVLTTLAFLPLGWFLVANGWYFLGAIAMALLWQQSGWLAHEFNHHQVFENRFFGHIMGIFFSNVVLGYSKIWWNDRHNSHHAITNVLEHDPDIDNIPLLAWAKSDLDRVPKWARYGIRYQAYYFLFVLPWLRIMWMIQSFRFVTSLPHHPNKAFQKEYVGEAIGLVMFYIWAIWFHTLLPFGWPLIMFILVSQLLSGFGTAIIVFFNHYACEKFDHSICNVWITMILTTTMNMTPGIWTDWICGGLNYQVEHHLFPTMPRHNLAKVCTKVMSVCEKHGLPYQCCDFMEGLKICLGYLQDMGTVAKQRVEEEDRQNKMKKSK